MPDATHWADALVRLRACADAVAWARQYPDLRAAWAACERGDWMLWLAGRVAGAPGDSSRIPLVRAACDCAELAISGWEARYPDDRRPREALVTARRWCDGAATLKEVRDAAADAAGAAYVTPSAGAYVAASAATNAAVSAFAVFAADAYAASAAYRAPLSRCADIVRHHYPEPPELPDA